MSVPSTPPQSPVNNKKTYAAAASPPRPIMPAVARLSLENSPPPTITMETFPPLSKPNPTTSPLGLHNLNICLMSCEKSILCPYSYERLHPGHINVKALPNKIDHQNVAVF